MSCYVSVCLTAKNIHAAYACETEKLLERFTTIPIKEDLVIYNV